MCLDHARLVAGELADDVRVLDERSVRRDLESSNPEALDPECTHHADPRGALVINGSRRAEGWESWPVEKRGRIGCGWPNGIPRKACPLDAKWWKPEGEAAYVHACDEHVPFFSPRVAHVAASASVRCSAQKKWYPDGGAKMIDSCVLPEGHAAAHVYEGEEAWPDVSDSWERTTGDYQGSNPARCVCTARATWREAQDRPGETVYAYRCDLHVPKKEPTKATKGPCERCGGNGWVFVDVGDMPGHAKRILCPECGKTRCGAVSEHGALCVEPKHGGVVHKGAHGLTWTGDYRDTPLRGWRFLEPSGAWGDVLQLKDAPDYPKTATHLCMGTPPMIEADVGYAIQCPRDGWIDVTDVVVRNFVVAWDPHDLLPNGDSAGESGLLARLVDMLEPMVRRVVDSAVKDARRAEEIRAAGDVVLENIKEEGRS